MRLCDIISIFKLKGNDLLRWQEEKEEQRWQDLKRSLDMNKLYKI